MSLKKPAILAELQTDILRLQGFKTSNNAATDIDLGPLKNAFPQNSFPLGAVHEFLSMNPEEMSATCGFISALLSSVMSKGGITFWISTSRTLFPPALVQFALEAERFVFIDVRKEKDVLWAVDEALKCSAISAVVGEVGGLSLTESRRLQLAVEQSQVTGFVLRKNYRNTNNTACFTRWKISSLPSEPVDDLPGIGFPKWRVELLKFRNGKTGIWDMQWINKRLVPVYHPLLTVQEQQKKAG